MRTIIFLSLLFCYAFRVAAQNITAAEYFFNADPGVGAGTPLAVGAAGTAVNFSATIPTTSLAPGFHTLAIRTKDANGAWGLSESRTVYISATAAASTPVVAAEYFIDNDPGPGAGTPIGVGTTGNTVNFSFALSTASLAPGFHLLAIRTKNAEGVWGPFETRGFYITRVSANAGMIAAAEYFIDVDPGAGNGTPVVITSGAISNFIMAVPTTSIASGFHTLAIRTKNADGVWSLFETRGFYVSSATTDMGTITEAEYFLDADPGVGNGSPLSITAPANGVTQNFLITIPHSTPNGQHFLAIRTKDANGVWGLFELREITVSGFPLPLDWLLFTGRRKEDTVVLQWRTANEINTSHFEVERSANGVEFKRIGQIMASGGAQNDYEFSDSAPVKGLNFYRLQQVDKNGAAKYSAIVKVYFGDAGATTLKLFPQPVNNELNIVFGGRGVDVLIQVYDAGGKIVSNERKQNASPIRLPTEGLAKGIYWIVVSDGITQQKAQFVKQ